MTDNTTPRELSADELAAIRERDAAMRNRTYPTNLSLADLLWAADDRAALLAHVASVDARCRAYEAALADVDQLISWPEESGCARGDVGCLLDKVRKVAFDALLRAANGDGGRGNDGSDGNGSGEAGT